LVTLIRSSARAISQLVQSEDEDNTPYLTLIVDQASLKDINAVQFAQLVRNESVLENLSLVLVNSSDTMINANRSNHFYISTIDDLNDRRALFNALHAAQSVVFSNSNIVTRAEYYENIKGAKNLSILVAEDNRVNQQVIEGISQKAGHKTRLTSTGADALDILSSEIDCFDMVILDMNMPEISGLEVVKATRFMDVNGRLPIIMLTADATPEAREKSLRAGVNEFLTKPIEARSLLQKIASLSFSKRQSGSEKIRTKPKLSVLMGKLSLYSDSTIQDLRLLGEDDNFITTLIGNFIIDGQQHVDSISSASGRDYLQYRESLHALKGSSTELGATALIKCCLQGEAFKPRDINSEEIAIFSNQLQEVFKNTSTALKLAINTSSETTATIRKFERPDYT
jgi:two-component system, sensor histidine kinase RpfC